MIIIHAERDSVCMGDDVAAPNEKDFLFVSNKPIDSLMQTLSGYVPAMKNVVWAVSSDQQTIGYLFSDETARYQYELAGTVRSISDLPERSVFCNYYYSSKLPEERFPGCPTLLDRVKASIGENPKRKRKA
ncbi:MAG: hypothetical protein IJ206_04300 [Oscillospiraceae bacterium]|nr:hypothetical protein [Oscillospiraceae bacterium]